jgi:hypothetical protein
MGNYMTIGSNPTGITPAYPANVAFTDVRVDALHMDGATAGQLITDYYSTTVPTDRTRTIWRAVLDPGQKGRPCKMKNNTYSLDLALLEAR